MARWTEEDVLLLKETYPVLGLEKSAEILRRTKPSIRQKASRLKLKSPLAGKHNIVDKDNIISRLKDTEYELVSEYTRANKKALYKHKTCGYEWESSYNNLVKLVGCPNCSTSGNKESTKFVYLCYFEALGLHKVGVTADWDKRKYDFLPGTLPKLLQLVECDSNESALELEEFILSDVELYNTGELRNGNTETFLCEGFKQIKELLYA